MVLEIKPASESCQKTANISDDRKRLAELSLAPRTSDCATQTPESKRSCPTPANNGWGPIFKDRETFVEMHIC